VNHHETNDGLVHGRTSKAIEKDAGQASSLARRSDQLVRARPVVRIGMDHRRQRTHVHRIDWKRVPAGHVIPHEPNRDMASGARRAKTDEKRSDCTPLAG
jgi:hypothetical protein